MLDHDTSSILERTMQAFMENIHTATLGKIVEYKGHGTRIATVLPLIRPWLLTGEVVSNKPIDNVPVMFPSSATSGLIMPVRPGDTVLLLFCETGVGGFLDSAGDDQVDADGATRFAGESCIAIAGVWAPQAVPKFEVAENEVALISEFGDIRLSEGGFSVRDSGGNAIVSTSNKITINGNLEVMQ